MHEKLPFHHIDFCITPMLTLIHKPQTTRPQTLLAHTPVASICQDTLGKWPKYALREDTNKGFPSSFQPTCRCSFLVPAISQQAELICCSFTWLCLPPRPGEIFQAIGQLPQLGDCAWPCCSMEQCLLPVSIYGLGFAGLCEYLMLSNAVYWCATQNLHASFWIWTYIMT